MSDFYPPEVGPILGYRNYGDDAVSQWLFVRGKKADATQYCHVLVRERAGGFKKTVTRELGGSATDYSLLMVLDGLPLDTGFDYKVCCSQSSAPKIQYDTLKAKNCFHGSFETRNRNDTVTSFIVGSCCHFSLLGINQADDAAFKTLREQWAAQAADDDLILMLGDQIYGDHRIPSGLGAVLPGYRQLLLALPIKKKEKLTPKHYLKHYRKAFTRKDKRRVMASLPVYMTFDDHEVHNDWGSKDFLNESQDYDVLSAALSAYNIYQVAHPDIVKPDTKKFRFGQELPDARYYYEFSHGKCDFFVMDTRYEKRVKQQPIQMISPAQMRALEGFLVRGTGRVKFIASSIPMFPDASDKWLAHFFDPHPEDRWEGHLSERMHLLEYIRTHVASRNPNVFVLSGDVHCSFVSSLSHCEDDRFRLHQITSSAFNWGTGLNDMHFSKYQPLKGSDDKYLPANLSGKVVTPDNFCRVIVKTKKAEVHIIDAKSGATLRRVDLELL